MTGVDPPRRPPLHRIARAVRVRPRLMTAAVIGLVIAVVAPRQWQPATRLLAAWDIAVGLYLVLALGLMRRADITDIRQHANLEDEGRITVLILTAAAAIASLGGILAQIGMVAGGRSQAALGLAAVTILLSWSFIHVMFALHYAHEFYDDDRTGKVLQFPGDEEPDYFDFLYFAFVIGMTAQVSDVAVTDKSVRRTVAAHGIVSFFFNAALLALVVNIAATAI